jgi:hypothetical protein
MALERGTLVSSIAALGGVIAAMSCCLPVGTFLVAAGAAGAGRILAPLRPWLFGVSIGALILGFVQAYGRSHCSLRRNPMTILLLWVAAAMVLAMWLFPQVVAGFLADKVLAGSEK